MAIELATKFLPYVDEQFSTESKKSLLTNTDFDWTGAHTVKVYRITTSAMNDYDRAGTGSNWSFYGPVAPLSATTQEMTLTGSTRTKRLCSWRRRPLWPGRYVRS